MAEAPLHAHPLHEAVKNREVDRVRSLLEAGSDPNELDLYGQPPLRYVLTYGSGFVVGKVTAAMIEALIKAGADPKLAGVGEVLVNEANDMVTAALEVGEVKALMKLLGV